ncbi:allantoinase AllB [Microvirga lotononidis]|uniref:allantoinase n=1 Tax=Microvirga lotononidis TaxID=864069 RepID=I4YUF3_9HYPH|nr:allantoinase AllB [Microvirga lotononidis]EIM27595.1 allantoinase [Microvirga lotononidis]WQO28259.1 allantoinase AllB [Microvirga lotononidis]
MTTTDRRYETLVCGGTVVTETGASILTIAITDGRIVGILDDTSLHPAAKEIIDATGLIIVPGAIDAHTHFTGSNPFPREEVSEGTKGAARGGVTTYLEMPHSNPPATTLAGFLAKRELLSNHSAVDFGLWAGLTGANLDEIPALVDAGAAGFKAFLCSPDPGGDAPDPSGLPRLKDGDLLKAMRVIARYDCVIGIHAENHDLLQSAGQRQRRDDRHDARAHALAGPEIAEIEAVNRVVLLAQEAGVRAHIVHLSSARAAADVQHRERGARVSIETCPQYLLLTEDDLAEIGPFARCGPPLRSVGTVEELWAALKQGLIDTLASDHCPYLVQDKERGRSSIWEAGMGLTGIETAVPLFFSACRARGVGLVQFARMTATNPAKVFGLYGRKGAISVGFDADLVFYDPDQDWTVQGRTFLGHGKWSAFEGRQCQGKVVRTILRGKTIFEDGQHRQMIDTGREVLRTSPGSVVQDPESGNHDCQPS